MFLSSQAGLPMCSVCVIHELVIPLCNNFTMYKSCWHYKCETHSECHEKTDTTIIECVGPLGASTVSRSTYRQPFVLYHGPTKQRHTLHELSKLQPFLRRQSLFTTEELFIFRRVSERNREEATFGVNIKIKFQHHDASFRCIDRDSRSCAAAFSVMRRCLLMRACNRKISLLPGLRQKRRSWQNHR